MKTIANHLKGKLLAGLFVVIPIGITIFILKFLFNFADGIPDGVMLAQAKGLAKP